MRRLPFLVSLLVSMLSTGTRADSLLYNGSLNTTPDAQGWFYGTDFLLATQSAAGGMTTFSSTADNAIRAGYSTLNPITNEVLAGMPTLDRAGGYTVEFDVKVDSESHASADRAGFNLIALSSDRKGIELGFWTSQVWAQSDNPLFMHAEGASFDTAQGVIHYQLAVQGDSYRLFAGSSLLLAGSLRDYSSFGKPYTYQNFLFLGDDTTSASAQIELARVAVLSYAVPEPSSIVLISLGGMGIMACSQWPRRVSKRS